MMPHNLPAVCTILAFSPAGQNGPAGRRGAPDILAGPGA